MSTSFDTSMFNNGEEDADTAKRFSEVSVRTNFIKKVCSLVGVQLLATSVIIGLMMSYEKELYNTFGSFMTVFGVLNGVFFFVTY